MATGLGLRSAVSRAVLRKKFFYIFECYLPTVVYLFFLLYFFGKKLKCATISKVEIFQWIDLISPKQLKKKCFPKIILWLFFSSRCLAKWEMLDGKSRGLRVLRTGF